LGNRAGPFVVETTSSPRALPMRERPSGRFSFGRGNALEEADLSRVRKPGKRQPPKT
jgi:hypothetical protein